MNYIGIFMSKINVIMLFLSLFYANSSAIFWDLGVSVSQFSIDQNNKEPLDIKTYHRIEGIKKYYIEDFEGAVFHFEKLNHNSKALISYEYANALFKLNHYDQAINVIEKFDSQKNNENLQYLKSQILLSIEYYDDALNVLENMLEKFINSEYSNIIKFDIEKINLLKWKNYIII